MADSAPKFMVCLTELLNANGFEDLLQAKEEAAKRARANPGNSFVVLQSWAEVVQPPAKAKWIDHIDQAASENHIHEVAGKHYCDCPHCEVSEAPY